MTAKGDELVFNQTLRSLMDYVRAIEALEASGYRVIPPGDGLDPRVCTDPDCAIPRKPGRPMHGPHDFRVGGTS
jgi:hypothetical protein